MKILVIPDVHGTHCWEIAKDKINEVDHIVFLGDYFDCWENEWPDQGENFKNIARFKEDNPDKVTLLMGNHDWSYMSGTREGANCSGHQYKHIGEIRALLTMNKYNMDIAAEFDGYVFAHAGFTKTWIGSMLQHFHIEFDKYPDEAKDITDKLVWDEKEFGIQFLNDYFHERTHTPGDETFDYGFDELLDWYGYFSGSGDEITQGPLWVRPNSLLKDAYYPKQVVGHTEYAFYGEPIKLVNESNQIILSDSESHSNIFILDTENENISPMTVPEFNTLYKHIEKTINDIHSKQPHSKEDIEKLYNEMKYTFTENQKKFIINKLYNILENSFEVE